MRDYSFTVEILRSCAEDNCETCPIGGAKYTSKDCRKAHNDAADAIEELLAKNNELWIQLHVEGRSLISEPPKEVRDA